MSYWPAIAAAVPTLAAIFVPAITIILGLTLVVVALGAAGVIQAIAPASRRAAELMTAGSRWANRPTAFAAIAGIALVSVGAAGASLRADRRATEIARIENVRRQQSEDTERATKAAEADARAARYIADAEAATDAGDPDAAIRKLDAAERTPNTSRPPQTTSARTRAANRKCAQIAEFAAQALAAGNVDGAAQLAREAAAIPSVTQTGPAEVILKRIADSTDPGRVRAALVELSDDAFDRLSTGGPLPSAIASGHAELDKRAAAVVKAELPAARADRRRRAEELAAAEQKKKELEAAAAEAARMKAEEARRKMEAAAKEAQLAKEAMEARKREEARRAEEETNFNGLVLFNKSVVATQRSITGIVENRTGRDLNYAQIIFNLYDSDDNQVGSVLANVNGLEAGGRWSFEAVCFGRRYATYKPFKAIGR
jgi:hypothetical protein